MRFSTLLSGCVVAVLTLAASRGAAQTTGAADAGSAPTNLSPNATDATDAGAAPDSSPPSAAESTAPAEAPTTVAPTAAAPAPPTEAPPQVAPEVPPAPPGGESPKRAIPDYDGRGDDPTTAGDVMLWIPRIILSPAYFVSEYIIRRPLGWLITTAEQNHWPSTIANFFVFGPDKKAGIVPTFFLDLGFRPSVGVYMFWDDLLGKDNHLRLHFSTFGPDWLQGAVADKIPVGKDAFFDLRFEGVHRPDLVFHGLGPRTLQADRSRYGLDKLQARPVFETTWWKGSRVTVEAGVRYMNFRDDACCGDPSVTSQIARGRYPTPPGFDDGYTAVYERGELTVDTRDPRPTSQTGARLELENELGSNVRSSKDNWIRYGGSVGGFLDVKNNRTVSLSVSTLFVDPLSGGGSIPFTEQIVLGGSGLMRGFLYGRLTDRSAAVATLKYRWPIWVLFDGTMQGAIGNVFGPQLEDFKTKLLRVTANVGIETIGSPDHTFEFLVGFGTETIEHGANVNSARLLFGTNRGF